MRVHAITLDKELTGIEMLPLSDMHIGSPDFDKAAFQSYIKYILTAPNRFALINGDIINNAL